MLQKQNYELQEAAVIQQKWHIGDILDFFNLFGFVF